MPHYKTVSECVHPDVIGDLTDILNGITENKQDSIIHSFTADFGDGYEMDINVVGIPDNNRRGNSYVDTILYKDGHEIEVIDVNDEILVENIIIHDEICYTFNLIITRQESSWQTIWAM